jgi:hypothetical protein
LRLEVLKLEDVQARKNQKGTAGVLKDDYKSGRRHSLWVPGQVGAKAGERSVGGGGVEDIEDGGGARKR